ncbi:hypothetical protein ACOCJ4_16460 [Knoellia sp. CPCC 206435]|uniref:hypothetical protein n=1 Tax=Knoellia terrae TaxID=3404797 RepID=UPI003B437EBC
MIASRTTATLTGTITNETGLDVDVNASAPVVEAWDTNEEHVYLYGSFEDPPKDFGGVNAQVVLRPGDSITYRSLAVPMQTPDRNWKAVRWNPIAQFNFEDTNFCQQRSVPGLHIIR